jgi:phospholipid/cholesterol/gamma-HCH transport system permease protein
MRIGKIFLKILKEIPKIIQGIGADVLLFFERCGRFFMFVFYSLKYSLTPKWYFKLIFDQMIKIGFYSLPVVGLTAIFTGGVLALQTYLGASRLSAESTVPTIVVLSITRELGPVLASLMVAGRISASIAAELGTMRVTEQIDALTTLSTNPFRYLVAPRIIASTLTAPILVLIADIIGILGGFLASVYSLGFSAGPYIQKTFEHLKSEDVISGLIKATVFGYIIALMGCFNGYNSKGGAEGVGHATTNAVVSASILILLFNYIMTEIFFV